MDIMDSTHDDSKRADLRQFTKTKIMGKLFTKGKDKDKEARAPTTEQDVLDFLKGSHNPHATDTSTYQDAAPAPIQSASRDGPLSQQYQHSQQLLARKPYLRPYVPPKRIMRDTTGLSVQFTERWPEIIGHGGDETEDPSIMVSETKAKATARAQQNAQESSSVVQSVAPSLQRMSLLRAQTGLPPTSTARGYMDESTPVPRFPQIPSVHSSSQHDTEAKLLTGDREPSPLYKQNGLEMRTAEGIALHAAKAMHSAKSQGDLDRNDSVASRVSRQSQASSVYSEMPVTPILASAPASEATLASPLTRATAQMHGNVGPLSAVNSLAATDNDEALEDFVTRVSSYFKLFALSADSVKPLRQCSLDELIRLASWWFLKGRSGIEVAARSSGAPQSGTAILLKEQGHADLAKSFWLMQNTQQRCEESSEHPILGNELSTHRSSGKAADVLNRCHLVRKHLGKISSSMKRNNFLPPVPEDAPLSAGINNAIWEPLPSVPQDMHSLLNSQGNPHSNLHAGKLDIAHSMPLEDAPDMFNYNRMFVPVYLLGDPFLDQDTPICCLLSISRSCQEDQIRLFLTDQSGVLDLCIQPDRSDGMTWQDVTWQHEISSIDLKLPRGFAARVQLALPQYTMLLNLYNHVCKAAATIRVREDEVTIYDKLLKNFEFLSEDQQEQHIFSRRPVGYCYIRLFAKKVVQNTGSGQRTWHCGYRLAIMTSTQAKQLDGLSHDLPCHTPTRYSFMRDPIGDPSMSLTFQRSGGKSRMAMTFSIDHDRNKFHHLLIGGVAADEATLAKTNLSMFAMTDMDRQPIAEKLNGFMAWSAVQVMNWGTENVTEAEGSKVVYSDHLRLLILSRFGTLTDRINVSPGELRFRINPSLAGTISKGYDIVVARKPQADLTFAISESHVPRGVPADVSQFLAIARQQSTLRTYSFPALNDLHTFQLALTGYRVLFDTTAVLFSIARRRTVVPIYKKWECTSTRIQIVRSEKTYQLIAWFDNFAYGSSMNFVLKSTDVIEKMDKKGAEKSSLKLVDAKFHIPNGGKGPEGEDIGKGWVKGISLDDPEYPTEHDDILITFSSEAERDGFACVLPADVHTAARMSSVASANIASRMGSTKY